MNAVASVRVYAHAHAPLRCLRKGLASTVAQLHKMTDQTDHRNVSRRGETRQGEDKANSVSEKENSFGRKSERKRQKKRKSKGENLLEE